MFNIDPGLYAILVILGSVGAVIWVFSHRQYIWTDAPQRSPAPQLSARRIVKPAETPPKQAATISPLVSPVATPNTEAETVSLRLIAKLVKANVVTQTAAIEAAFDVRAGSSKRYVALVERYKLAAAELDRTEQTATKAA